MYIYKREKNVYSLMDYVGSTDEFEIEERIIKIMRKDKSCKNFNKILVKFTGLFTVYHFNGPYCLIVSKYLLNPDGTVKTEETKD